MSVVYLEKMNRANLLDLLKKTATKWNDQNAPRLGASLAFYTLLSLAPLVILVVAICGLFLNRSTAETQFLSQASQLVGYSGAKTLQSLIDNAKHAEWRHRRKQHSDCHVDFRCVWSFRRIT